MAEKKQQKTKTFKEVMTDLKGKNYSPVYLLQGEESYYIDKVCDWITGNILTEDEKDFNLMMLYGTDVTAQQVVDTAKRFPLMAERQIVVVREAQGLKNFDALERYLEKPVETTILVLCYMGGTVDGRKKLPVLVAAKGTVMLSSSPRYDRDIVAFIDDYIKQPGYEATIEQKASYVIAAHIGGDLKRLASELDKVKLSFEDGAKRVITSELVEQKIGISKNYNVFEFRDALVNKDAAKAFRIAKYFDDNPKAGGLFALLPQVFTFFQNLMLAYYTPKPVNDTAIMAQLGLKTPWQVRDYVTAMRNYPARKTIMIISKIREVDARSKGLDNFSTAPGELLKELISFILY